MNSSELGRLTLLARTAFAVMCFERYAKAVYPTVNYRPVAEMMWHIIDGSDWLDEAAYKYSEIIPDSLFEEETYEASAFRYLTQQQFRVFRQIINREDADLNTLMQAVFDVAMSYVYTSVEPGAAVTLPYLQTVIDVLEKHEIELPDSELLAEHSAPEDGPTAFNAFDWMGGEIDPAALSLFGVTKGSSTVDTYLQQTVTENGCEWVIEPEEGGVSIIKCRNRDHLTELTVPAQFNGVRVSSIASNAFIFSPESGCQFVENLILPDCILRIGDNFFKECRRLRTVKMPAELQTLGHLAFQAATRLTEITIGECCTEIGSRFCADCTALEHVTIGSALETIGEYSFYGCPSMKTFLCTAKLRKIGYGSFWCNRWADTILDNPATEALYMGRRACVLYRYVKRNPPPVVRIDAKVRYVYDFAFGGDAWQSGDGITDIYLPGVRTIGVHAFRKVPNATVHLSYSMMVIEYGADRLEQVAEYCQPAKAVFDLP